MDYSKSDKANYKARKGLESGSEAGMYGDPLYKSLVDSKKRISEKVSGWFKKKDQKVEE